MHQKIASNETSLASEIPYIINNENIIIILGQWKKLVSVLSDELCEEQAFSYSLPKGKFGYKGPRDILKALLGIFIKGCSTLINTLHQMQSIYFLLALCMSNTTHIHQYILLCTKLNQVRSQQEQLRIVSNEELKCLLQETMHFNLWVQSKEHQHTGNSFYMIY